MSTLFPLRLVSSHFIAPTVRHVTLLRDDGQPLDFIPGQFIQLHFTLPDGTPVRRSYSLATRHDHHLGPGETVEIVVSQVPGGAAASLFDRLQPGDRVEASGPLGRFCLMPGDHNARYLLVATGTGITPYRAMLPELARQIAARGLQVVLLQGARSQSELLYADEFRAFAAAHPGFRYLPCLSREQPTAAQPDLRAGYVQAHLVDCQPDAARDIAYVCGNPNMVDAVADTLKAAGFGPAIIRREKYVSPSVVPR